MTTPTDETIFCLSNYLHFRKPIWRALRHHYPALVKNVRYRLLFGYLLSAYRDEDTGNIPLSTVIVSRIYARDNQVERNTNITVDRDIRAIEALTGCTIKLTKYDKRKGLAREVYLFQLSPEMAEVLYPADAASVLRAGLVNLVTGKLISEKDRAEYAAARLAEIDARNAACPIAEHQVWMHYLNHDIGKPHFRLKPEHIADAVLYTETLDDPDQQEYARRALVHLLTEPHTLYAWSKQERSPRMFGQGIGWPTINKEMRKRLLPDLLEFDLASCHLAVFAQLGQVQSVVDFLASGQELWRYLAGQIELLYSEEVKAVLKVLVYEIVYGCLVHRLFFPKGKLTRKMLSPFTAAVRAKFLAIPMIVDLLAARQAMLAAIRKAKGATDGYTRWIAMARGNKANGERSVDAKSVLSQVCQSYESVLLEPLRRLTLTDGQKENGWYVLIWQHDGCSIRVKHARDTADIVARLTAAVNARATELGMVTHLECKRAFAPLRVAKAA